MRDLSFFRLFCQFWFLMINLRLILKIRHRYIFLGRNRLKQFINIKFTLLLWLHGRRYHHFLRWLLLYTGRAHRFQELVEFFQFWLMLDISNIFIFILNSIYLHFLIYCLFIFILVHKLLFINIWLMVLFDNFSAFLEVVEPGENVLLLRFIVNW